MTLVSGLPYYKIRQLLKDNAYINVCEELCLDCYNSLIEDYFGYQPIYLPYDITVGKFAKTHPKGKYLVRMDGHISSVINGLSVDTFDCTNLPISNAWRVE